MNSGWLTAREAVEVRAHVGSFAQVRIDRLQVAAEADVFGDERLPDAAAVLVIEVEHGAAREVQPVAHPVGEHGAVRQVAGADPERVVARGGHVGRGRRRADGDHGVAAAVVDWRGGERHAGEQVAHDGGDIRVVEVARDEDRRVRIGVVVPRHQLEPAAVDPAGGVDLLRGELGGLPHRKADRIAEGARHADPHGPVAARRAGDEQPDRGQRQRRAERK